MSEYTLPGGIKKTITFPRLSSKNVEKYDIYSKTVDSTYASGFRVELIDSIQNPAIPDTVKETIELDYNPSYTWPLPKDIYLDRDHGILIQIDDIQISKLYYTINKVSKLFTINTNQVTINPDTNIKLTYYKDVVSKSYSFEEDCSIIIKPILSSNYSYGKHNIIL